MNVEHTRPKKINMLSCTYACAYIYSFITMDVNIVSILVMYTTKWEFPPTFLFAGNEKYYFV